MMVWSIIILLKLSVGISSSSPSIKSNQKNGIPISAPHLYILMGSRGTSMISTQKIIYFLNGYMKSTTSLPPQKIAEISTKESIKSKVWVHT